MEENNFSAEGIQAKEEGGEKAGEFYTEKIAQDNIQAGEGEDKDKKKKEGFKGWLALLALNIIAAPIITLVYLIIDFQLYDGIDIFLALLTISTYSWLCYLMVKKQKSFTKWFIGFGVFKVLFYLLSLASAVVFREEFTTEDIETISEAATTAFVYTAVWSAYLLKSKRVKNTFVK